MRREIKKGYIKVAYGYDDITGHFLSVYDTRLQFQRDAPAEANKIANQVDEKQGFAGYFELHTGMGGFGFHTSVDTMVYYWTLYGVPKDDVERARTGLMVRDYYRRQARDSTSPPQPISKNQVCLVCGESTTLRCTNCGAFWACGPEHAKEAWKKHKPECKKKSQAAPKPVASVPAPLKSKYPIERIKGYFFGEDTTTPEIVDIEVERRPAKPDDGQPAWAHYAIPGILNLFQANDFPLRISTLTSSGDLWAWGDGSPQLVVYYADDLSIGDYTLNGCVVELTKGKAPRKWAGPVLLMKYPQHSVKRFGDVDSNDLESAVRFFNTYGSWSSSTE